MVNTTGPWEGINATPGNPDCKQTVSNFPDVPDYKCIDGDGINNEGSLFWSCYWPVIQALMSNPACGYDFTVSDGTPGDCNDTKNVVKN